MKWLLTGWMVAVVSLTMFLMIGPLSSTWFDPSTPKYYLSVFLLNAATLAVPIYLIKWIWGLESISRKKKWDWTWFLVFLNVIAALIYLWGFEKEDRL